MLECKLKKTKNLGKTWAGSILKGMSKVGKKMVCRLSEMALPLSTGYAWYCSSALFWGWAAIMDCLWKKAAMFFCNLLNLLGVSWRAFYIYTVFNYCCFICDMTGVALLLGTAILGGKPSSLQGTSDLRLHKAPSTSLNLCQRLPPGRRGGVCFHQHVGDFWYISVPIHFTVLDYGTNTLIISPF